MLYKGVGEGVESEDEDARKLAFEGCIVRGAKSSVEMEGKRRIVYACLRPSALSAR